MAYGKVILERNLGGIKELKEAPVGFSWTTLFFGVFPALFRGDWKWASIMFMSALITGGLSWLVFPFFYNKIYLKDLIKDGFKVKALQGLNLQKLELYVGMPVSTTEDFKNIS